MLLGRVWWDDTTPSPWTSFRTKTEFETWARAQKRKFIDAKLSMPKVEYSRAATPARLTQALDEYIAKNRRG